MDIWEAIKKSFYVDDFLRSYPDVETARKVRIGLTEALAKGGFELLKWKSSHLAVLEENEPQEESIKVFHDKETAESAPSEKVLGVAYSLEKDIFQILIRPRSKQVCITLRNMLSIVHALFDPLGFVCPFTLLGKQIFQRSMSLKLEWDDQIPPDLRYEFDKWQNAMPALEEMAWERWLATPETTDSEADLHIFADASKTGFGVVAYRVCYDRQGKAQVSFYFARANVVSLQSERREEKHHDSIPRLELTAARLAVIVMWLIMNEAGEKFRNVYLWTDSECVINQIRDQKTRFATFVHNRLTKIRELSNPNQ